MHAEICPVCSGKGRLEEKTDIETASENTFIRTCHGCSGKGWVEVTSEEPIYYSNCLSYHWPTYILPLGS